MATGDIAIVSMQPGTEGFMIPSKAFYYLAARCYLHFTGNENSEIGVLCKKHKCGYLASRGNTINLMQLQENIATITHTATELIQRYYSKKPNTEQFVKLLKKMGM